MNNLGTLYFFTGKMGAGKTTMSKQLTNEKMQFYYQKTNGLKVCIQIKLRQ
ncbi:EutP/PduV family microcompartment system protein [Mammaliicoccus sciuri]|uniref:EutP/PduV family microcompartment system protein n=1 Tax=Mammaliicoccus sciuri TaxID=1296 RepID=UPI002DBCBF8A|nr:EutP/PduV family microcompartment system protein [Mammaliicoccus sciuri]